MKEKMRHPWPWPTYKQNKLIIRRLQQLHVAVRHSNCLLGKWTHPLSLSSLRVTPPPSSPNFIIWGGQQKNFGAFCADPVPLKLWTKSPPLITSHNRKNVRTCAVHRKRCIPTEVAGYHLDWIRCDVTDWLKRCEAYTSWLLSSHLVMRWKWVSKGASLVSHDAEAKRMKQHLDDDRRTSARRILRELYYSRFNGKYA